MTMQDNGQCLIFFGYTDNDLCFVYECNNFIKRDPTCIFLIPKLCMCFTFYEKKIHATGHI
jgi:hypothetical protein